MDKEFSIRDLVSIRSFREETAELAGVEMKLASLTENEVETIVDMLDKMLYKNANYAVKSLVVENIDLIIDLIRAVKAETKQEFAGPRAKGNALTLVDMTADLFTYVWGNTGAMTFEIEHTTTGPKDYIGTEASPQTIGEEEGMIILGFIDTATEKTVNKVLLTKNGEPYPYHTLVWEAVDDFPVAALPEPYIFTPETNFHIQAYVYKTGYCKMRPLGFKVLQGKNIMKF